MIKTRLKYKSTATIPKALEQKLKLNDGDVLKVIVENGELALVKAEYRLSNLMKYAGIWKDKEAENVFKEIRKVVKNGKND